MGRSLSAVFGASLITLACATSPASLQPTVGPMHEQIVALIKAKDVSAKTLCSQPDDTITQALVEAFDEFDIESLDLALDCLAAQQTPAAAQALLTMTNDKNPDVAAGAVNRFARLVQFSSGDAILAALAEAEEPFIREQLYLVLGATGNNALTAPLQSQAQEEDEPETQLAALAALARLAEPAAEQTFLELLRTAEADDAVDLSEKLVYTGNTRLLKGLLPWLTNQEGVFRLGSDRHPDTMVRVCDLAAWTAQQMGVAFTPPLAHIDIFDDQVLAQAHSLLSRLP